MEHNFHKPTHWWISYVYAQRYIYMYAMFIDHSCNIFCTCPSYCLCRHTLFGSNNYDNINLDPLFCHSTIASWLARTYKHCTHVVICLYIHIANSPMGRLVRIMLQIFIITLFQISLKSLHYAQFFFLYLRFYHHYSPFTIELLNTF